MAYGKKTPALSRAVVKKRLSEQKREERKEDERKAEDDAARKDGQESSKERSIVMVLAHGDSGHHCKKKDGPTTHVMTSRCFRKKHMGCCPICGTAVGFQYSCDKHKWIKGDALQFTNIVFPEHMR